MTSHCPKSRKRNYWRWLFPAGGLMALVWFLFRVIPKPSRAAYPCQQAAAPLASGFVLWLAGALGSAALFRNGQRLWRNSRAVLACVALAAAVTVALGVFTSMPPAVARADANQPLGVGKGIHPGRVVWAHDAQVTKWAGPGQGHWWEDTQTIPANAERMMSQAVVRLAGANGEKQAWASLFRDFNRTHGGGNAGYKAGEKIAIKVNFVGLIFGEKNIDAQTYDFGGKRIDYMNTSPQLIRALLRQLVKNAGVKQEDIAVGDPLALFPSQYYNLLHEEFPNVRYVDRNGGSAAHARAGIGYSKVPLYWSARPEGKTQDFIPTLYTEAKYVINFANLKAHTMAGVTLCGKNHFGSLIRTPPQAGYFDMHESTAGRTPGMGKYRDIVDLTGHAQLGGKTLLYLIDGLYPGVHPVDNVPRKFQGAPFNGNWAASLLASQDPVAIDSVGYDLLWSELPEAVRKPGVDDYLHEEALADNPPSGTFYDPNHEKPTARLASLGVHEHWNNPEAKQYSRNLGRKEGIELVRVEGAELVKR